ncbi:hypothetical protein KR215_005074 [Drosophila sulfurigaster]|nr:hypothetical protein KR215_005074 [Drosophila sulfurigaster]
MVEKATTKKTKYHTILSLAFAAIEAMPSRSGSSVQAIVKYMKSNGFEGTVEPRLSKLVLKNLKAAVIRGELEQVKRSFKLSAASKNKSKALEKMKLKKAKAKEKEKLKVMKGKKDSAAPKAKSSAKAKTTKEKSGMKPSERKTNEPSKKAKKDKAAAAAASSAKEDVEDSEKPKKTVKGKASASKKKMESVSESNAKAKSKAVRKSIGTLAQQVPKKKVASKKVKLVVAAKIAQPVPMEEGDSEFTDSAPTEISTPIRVVKTKAARRVK